MNVDDSDFISNEECLLMIVLKYIFLPPQINCKHVHRENSYKHIPKYLFSI